MATIRVPPAEGETAPDEPVTLPEAKAQCRVDYDDEDTLIQTYLMAARAHAETVTRRTLLPSLWDHTLDGFPSGAIRLPHPPLIEVESVHYIAPDGSPVEMEPTAYQWDARQEPGLLMPAYGTSWPATRLMPGAVWVRYRAGYPDGVIPHGIKVAILMLVGHWFTNREAVVVGTITATVPLAVDTLLWADRFYEVS